jgi:hypothetical protein
VDVKRAWYAASTAAYHRSGWPLIASAFSTLPSSSTMKLTVTVPEARAALSLWRIGWDIGIKNKATVPMTGFANVVCADLTP